MRALIGYPAERSQYSTGRSTIVDCLSRRAPLGVLASDSAIRQRMVVVVVLSTVNLLSPPYSLIRLTKNGTTTCPSNYQ